MRLFHLWIAVPVLAVAMGFPLPAPERRPHLIFLLADDQCTYSVGCYGNKDVKTPNMDRLAKEGMAFDRHYDTTSICMASRATIMTGLYEYRTGCNFTSGNMSTGTWARSYPVLLRKAGYFTAFAGKFGFKVSKKGSSEKDFDLWGGGPGQTSYVTSQNESMKKYAEKHPHSTLSYGAFGQDAIREAVRRNQPLCLSISFKAPHRPATPDPRFDGVYAGKTFTQPDNFGRAHGRHMSKQSTQGRQYKRFTEWKYDRDYDGVMAKYHQLVHAIDVALGMIREELERQGIADNTVILYTSDNGYICGSHGYASKVLPMEESSRVPLILLDPRAPTAGKKLRCRELTGNIDLAPTLLTLAGVPVPDNLDGKSLTPLLNDPEKAFRDQLAFMNVWGPEPPRCLTVLTGRWKYTYWWYGGKGMNPTEELFDLDKDPLELTNFASDPGTKEILEEMRERYDRELALWKERAVKESYRIYGTLFDRNVPWEKKAALLERKTASEKK